MLVQDDQQAMRLGWLTGILEGEGCFKKYPTSCSITITNTDLDIIENCEDILRENNIFFVTGEEISEKPSKKDAYRIRISRNSRDVLDYLKLFYDLVKPHLECRLNQFQELLSAPEITCGLSVNLGWLIGIYESEGSFSLTRNNHTNKIVCNTLLDNTNFRIIDKVALNLKALYCPFYIRDRDRRQDNHKDQRRIEISGFKRNQKFLKKTENLWISRRNQKISSLIFEFINSRLEMNIREPYTERQIQIVQTVRDLNR